MVRQTDLHWVMGLQKDFCLVKLKATQKYFYLVRARDLLREKRWDWVRPMVNVTVRPMVNVILKPTEMPMDWVRQKDFYLAKRMENATDLHWVMRTVTVRPMVNVTVRPMVSVTLKPTVRPMDWVRQ